MSKESIYRDFLEGLITPSKAVEQLQALDYADADEIVLGWISHLSD